MAPASPAGGGCTYVYIYINWGIAARHVEPAADNLLSNPGPESIDRSRFARSLILPIPMSSDRVGFLRPNLSLSPSLCRPQSGFFCLGGSFGIEPYTFQESKRCCSISLKRPNLTHSQVNLGLRQGSKGRIHVAHSLCVIRPAKNGTG